MKLEASKGFKLEWEGKEYTLRRPRVKESMVFAKAFNKLSADKVFERMELAIEQLDNLGLPRAVTEEMEMSHITAIQNLLNGVDTSGK
mgnify:CR=1 FL=1|tara:strand:- start:4916 stop:5179 length:264 start_codon:yes stop_codon:yes gene_type:complete